MYFAFAQRVAVLSDHVLYSLLFHRHIADSLVTCMLNRDDLSEMSTGGYEEDGQGQPSQMIVSMHEHP